MAKGYRQNEGCDFHEVYAAVAKPMSLKLFMALAAKFGWPVRHIDIVGAFPFLNAEVKKEMYIKLPEGHEQRGKCRLRKTLHGLKQVPREWYELLCSFLVPYGFTLAHADYLVAEGLLGITNGKKINYSKVHRINYSANHRAVDAARRRQNLRNETKPILTPLRTRFNTLRCIIRT